MSETLIGTLARLHSFMRDLDLPFALVGGMAIIARVGVRATRDVDIVVSLGDITSAELLARAVDHGYQYDPGDQELFDEGLIRMWVATEDGPRFGVDLIAADGPYLERVIARATAIDFGDVALPIATLEDLVVLKLEAHRHIDIEDVLAIKDLAGATLDFSYLRGTARDLGIIDRLRRRSPQVDGVSQLRSRV